MLSEKRNGRVTASAIGAILGVNPYQSREDQMRVMVRQYHGAEREFTGNEATEYGHKWESTAIDDYELDSGNTVVRDPDFVIHPEHDWLGCTPDGLIGEDGLVEIKCPYYAKKLYSLSDKPMYLYQCYLQLIITGRKWCDFYVWSAEKQMSDIATLHDAKKWFAEHFDNIKAFYDEYLEIVSSEKLSKPYLEDLEVDMSEDSEWLELEKAYLLSKTEMENNKAEMDKLKAELIDLAKAKGKKCKGTNLQAYKATRKGNVQYAKVPELKGVNLDEYRAKSSEYWVIK